MLETPIIITIIVCATGLSALVSRLIYSSKCARIECGCVKIDRKVSKEIDVNKIPSGLGVSSFFPKKQ